MPSALSAENSERGQLIKAQKLDLWSWSQKAINTAKTQMKVDLNEFPTRSRVDIYRLHYKTWDHKKEIVTATGLVLVPADIHTALPLMSYQHATRFNPKDAPSQMPFDPETHAAILYYASDYCIVSMPDYLGLGSEAKGPQFYLNAEIQAITAADLLRATQNFLQDKNIAYTTDLFLAGYSQGAHNTLALHKYLQQKEANAYRIRATAAMAGPYGLTYLTRKVLKDKDTGDIKIEPVFLALAILGMHEAYDFFPRFNKILAEPYATTMPEILKKANYREIAKALPVKIDALFNWFYVAPILADVLGIHPFWKAMAMNDVDNFVPNAPLLLIHSPTDNVVPYESSNAAYKKFQSLGANVELHSLDPKWVDHVAAALPSHPEASRFFKKHRP